MAGKPDVMVLDSSTEEHAASEEEVLEYAEYIGIDPVEEPHLMWIARKGVAAPLPSPWKACQQNTDDGEDEIFYFNFETGESVWEHPCDDMFRVMAKQYREKASKLPPVNEDEESKSSLGSNAAGQLDRTADRDDESADDSFFNDFPGGVPREEPNAHSGEFASRLRSIFDSSEASPNSKTLEGSGSIADTNAAGTRRDHPSPDAGSDAESSPRCASPEGASSADDAPPIATVKPGLRLQGESFAMKDLRGRTWERQVAKVEKQYGVDHPRVAEVLREQAAHHGSNGEPQKQLAGLERALQIYELEHGPDSDKVAGLLESLANCHESLGDRPAVSRCRDRQKRIREQLARRGAGGEDGEPEQTSQLSQARHDEDSTLSARSREEESVRRASKDSMISSMISDASRDEESARRASKEEPLRRKAQDSMMSEASREEGSAISASKETLRRKAKDSVVPEADRDDEPARLKLRDSMISSRGSRDEDESRRSDVRVRRAVEADANEDDRSLESIAPLPEGGSSIMSVSAVDAGHKPSLAGNAAGWRKVESEVNSLARSLTMLRDIREKQVEYLRLLKLRA